MIGVMARTGSAVAVALGGTAAAPRFLARREIGLVPEGLTAQPYHAAAGLRALADLVQARTVRTVAVVVKAVAVPGNLAGILRSHAWMHAAEGVLYRQAVLAAATECGWPARAVEQSALPAAEQVLGALGRAAGRPWRRLEKDAARAALAQLAAGGVTN